MKVLVIGAGNMGLTYSEGMVDSSLLGKQKLRIYDTDPNKIETLRQNPNFDVYTSLEDGLPKSDIVFLAVKPYHCEDLFKDMKPLINSEQIFVSLMAGVSIETIQNGLGVKKVIRTMPNLPAKVGKGVTSYTGSKAISRVELLMVRHLLDTTGTSIHVDTEKFIDASTGISGSGPAYVFYFMQSMLEAAQKMGFSDYDSKILVSNTFEGAIELFNQSDISPERWIDKVASKGGTTQAAIDSMEDNNVKQLIQDAAYAAFDRAVELGKTNKMNDDIKRVVVKVGTNVLTNKDNRILGPVLRELVRQISVLYEENIMVILVSSGSAIAGMEVLGDTNIKDKSIRRQVYSAVGQPRMMRHYYSIFHDYGMRCAQILATKRDFDPGKHRQNMINCYEGLLAEGVIPIANEDDAVSLTMSMFSDNDELASLVAELLDADRLIILSDTDGLYTGHPDDDESRKLNLVTTNQNVEKYVCASNKKEGEGRGGMASKLKIAKGTAKKDIPTYIANGKRENVIVDIINNKQVGTKFISA